MVVRIHLGDLSLSRSMRVILQRFTPRGVNLLKRIAPSSNGKRTVSETDNLGSKPRLSTKHSTWGILWVLTLHLQCGRRGSIPLCSTNGPIVKGYRLKRSVSLVRVQPSPLIYGEVAQLVEQEKHPFHHLSIYLSVWRSWSPRCPVTAEIAGSSPVTGAYIMESRTREAPRLMQIM